MAVSENSVHPVGEAVDIGTSVPIFGTPATTRSGTRLAPYTATTHWRPWPAFGVAVLLCAATVIIAVGGGLLVSGTNGSAVEGLAQGRGLIPLAAAQLAMIAGTLLAAGAKGDRLVPALSLRAPARAGFGSYARAFGVLIGAVTIITAMGHFVASHDATADIKGMAGLFRGPWWPLALTVIGIGAPLSEELLFRGFLQTALVPTRLGYWGAALVTTALWTAMHAGYTLFGLIEVFLIGLIFCLILRRTGSLRVTIACHAVYNTLIALVVMFAPRDALGF